MPIGELDVFEDLLAQCRLADRLEPPLEFGKIRVAREPRKLSAEAFEVAKGVIVVTYEISCHTNADPIRSLCTSAFMNSTE